MPPSPSRIPVPEQKLAEQGPNPVSDAPQTSSRRRIWPLLIVLMAAAALSAGVWTPRLQHAAADPTGPADRTARVIRGALERTIRLTGTITTKNFASIAAPMMLGPDAGRDLLLLHLAPAGSMVK